MDAAHFADGSAPASPDDEILGEGTLRPGIALVDHVTGGPLPQEPPPVPPPSPVPPVTAEPIRLPPRTTAAAPMPVINLGIQPQPPGPAGFPNCGSEEVLKAWGSVIAGGALAGVSVPGEAVTGGIATAGILGGGLMMWDGIDTLETCT